MHDGGQRYPGRSLFGTTLDSEGYYKGLSEEVQTSPVPSHQPVPQLEKHRGNLCKTESGSVLKPGLDPVRMMSPKSGNAKMAIGTKYDAKDCKPELKESLKRVPLSCDGINTEVQTDGDRSPVPSTPPTISDGVQSPRETPNREEGGVIPKNIKHKFGSHVVDELLTDDEVNKFLKQKSSSKSSDLEDSPAQPQENTSDDINWYEKIGYPLRCNIFPGPSDEWQSEAQSTYTKEVHHRFKRDLEHWHGRKTDELGVWTTELLACERLSRTLQQDFEERPKLTKNWPSVISTLGPGDPAVQPQPRPPKALRKAIPKPKKITPKLEGTTAKPGTAVVTEHREEIKTPAGRNVEKDESFWEFYNQPLPLP
ncbi:ciliary microtubule inner protein 4 [Cetorhinus maximus]